VVLFALGLAVHFSMKYSGSSQNGKRLQRFYLRRFAGVWLITHLLLLSVVASFASARPTPEEEFENAVGLYKKRDFIQALEIFRSLEEKYPTNPLLPDALLMQGQALRGLQNWLEAALVFSKAAEVHPTLADYALYYQGKVLKKAGQGGRSLEVFKSLVGLHPRSLLVSQAELKMAELYLQSGQYGEAAEVCTKLLGKNPKKDYPAQALIFLGQAKEGLGQWGEALQAFRELWLKYPLHPLAKKAQGRWESLAKEKNLIDEKIAPEALFRRSLQFYQSLLAQAALREMQRIEGFPPEAYPAQYTGERWIDELYFYRGMCFVRLKQYAKAVEAFDLVVANSRADEMAEKSLFWMIRALFRLGRKGEALNTMALLQASYPQGALIDQAFYLKARIFEDQEDLPRAVSLYREMAEKFPQSSLRYSALWQSGWLLFRSQDFPGAIQAWDGLLALHPMPPWEEKALYWKGRALQRLGKNQEAEGNFQRLRQSFPASYYNRFVSAAGRPLMTGKRNSALLKDQPLPSALNSQAQPQEMRNLSLEKGRLLARLGLLSAAVGELEAAEEEIAGEEMRLEISRLYREVGEYHRSAILVRKKMSPRPLAGSPSEKQRALYLLAYPLGYPSWINQYAQQRDLDPAFLTAVILEESRFDPQAVSPAGARGLMQVLPATANQIVRRVKVNGYSDTLLFDPEMNLRLGSWYLSSLMEDFGGKEIGALAAYNAGPHMAREWLAKNPTAPEDEFVENIPYAETRNYVIRVLGSARVYRMLYGASPKPENSDRSVTTELADRAQPDNSAAPLKPMPPASSQ
jgi:soluble lytic murein transglycosylase